MAFSDLLLGKKLSTEFIDVPVGFQSALIVGGVVLIDFHPQMLRAFVDMASRVIRLELSKPRVYENEFSKVQTETDGSITVLNARYKTRIRASKQVGYT